MNFVKRLFSDSKVIETMPADPVTPDTYRTPAPMTNVDTDVSMSIAPKTVQVTGPSIEDARKNYERAMLEASRGRDDRWDTQTREREVGIILLEIHTLDGSKYRKLIEGHGPDPERFRKDKYYPGVLMVDASPNSRSILEMPEYLVGYAESMYKSWLKESQERGFYEVECHGGMEVLTVFKHDEPPAPAKQTVDIPVRCVQKIMKFKKEHKITWRQRLIQG